MATLYELKDEWLQLLQLAEDGEIDADVFTDTLEGLDYEIELKADAYAKIISQLEHDSAALKTEEKRMANRRKTLENRIDSMKKNLFMTMRMTGKEKFKTDLFSFSIRKNPASVVLDTNDIPEIYLVPQDPVVNKKQIMADLKAGKDLSGLAHLEQSERLQIG